MNMKEYKRDYFQRNKHKWKQYRQNTKDRGNTSTKYRSIYRNKSLELLGDNCVRCGFADKRALQIDHIYGGGTIELKGSCTHKQYLRIKAQPSLYQILCANCNWIKRVENNEIPYHLPNLVK